MDFSALEIHPKILETRSDHLKILPNSDLVQTWCLFWLDMVMSESGLRQVWILPQMQTCSSLIQTWNIHGSDLNQI